MYKKIFLLLSIFIFLKSAEQRGRTLNIPTEHERARSHSPLSWDPDGRELAHPSGVRRGAGGFYLPDKIQELDKSPKKVNDVVADDSVQDFVAQKSPEYADSKIQADPESRPVVEFKIDVPAEQETIKGGYFLKNRDLEYFIVGVVIVAVIGAGYLVYKKYQKPNEKPKEEPKIEVAVPVSKIEEVREVR